ncbi:MAG: LptA/OstA family protein [Candidatus Omnitrophota bacterium]
MGKFNFRILLISWFFIFGFVNFIFAEPDQKLIDFAITGFDKKGAKSMELSGKSADIFQQNIKLQDVTAKMQGTDDNLVIKADKGDFDKTKNFLKLEENVKAEVHNNQDNVVLPNQVTITSQGPLEIDYKNKIAVFIDNVCVVRPDSTMFSDKLEIYFSGDGNKISHVVALDNVKILRDENISYCDRADFDIASDKLVLSGEPKLIINETPRN